MADDTAVDETEDDTTITSGDFDDALDESGDIDLSDQSGVIEDGVGALAGLQGATSESLGGAEKGEIDYGGVDATKLKEEAALDESNKYVSPESTVSGQLQGLLDADSAYMKTAERRAKEQAASLGLLGSSMAVGASQRAAIESALPIAQQDAKTFATAALEEQKTSNEISRMKAESDLSAVAREHLYDIDTETSRFNTEMQNIIETSNKQGNIYMESTLKEASIAWENQSQATLKTLEGQLQLLLDNNTISAEERAYASSQATQVMAGVYGTINDLMADADFMAAYADDPVGLTEVFNTWIDLGTSHVEFVGATAGLGSEYFGEAGYVGLLGGFSFDMVGYDPVDTDGADDTTTTSTVEDRDGASFNDSTGIYTYPNGVTYNPDTDTYGNMSAASQGDGYSYPGGQTDEG